MLSRVALVAGHERQRHAAVGPHPPAYVQHVAGPAHAELLTSRGRRLVHDRPAFVHTPAEHPLLSLVLRVAPATTHVRVNHRRSGAVHAAYITTPVPLRPSTQTSFPYCRQGASGSTAQGATATAERRV